MSCLVDLDRRVADMENQGMYSNPVSYYDFLQNRVMVNFKPKDEDSEKAPDFNLTLSKKMTYDMVGVLPFQLCVQVGLTRRLE
jgi:ubiquitin carboxyl-terminal hydrolase 7